MPRARSRSIWVIATLLLVLSALSHGLGRQRERGSERGQTRLPAAFQGPAECRAQLRARQRLRRPTGVARFASWNLRWFPDGEPQEGAAGTDLGWLACALAWLDVDVLAVQEVKQTSGAERALAELLGELNRLTGARYVARLDDCGRRVPQHVGLIWNEARVAAGAFQTVAALNPGGGACEDQLRPGLAAELRLAGGLDLTVVSAHFKSKADERAFGLRNRSFGAVPQVLSELSARAHDTDVLLLGDLNTMGCRSCRPRVSAEEEQAAVRRQLASADLLLLAADAPGTYFHGGRATLLDHAVVAATMRELPATARVHVSGFCDAERGSRRATEPSRRALSDHCPIVLDLIDRDLD